MASIKDTFTEQQRGLLDRGLPPLDIKEFIRQRLEGGDFIHWKEANQALVLRMMPDGSGYAGLSWVAELEAHRIVQQMAAERASQTRDNLNDFVGGLAYGAGTAQGWDADKLSDFGAMYSPAQLAPGQHVLNRQNVVGAPRNMIHGAPTYQRSVPALRSPSRESSPQPRLTAPPPPKSDEEARSTVYRLKGPSPLVRGQVAAPKATSIKRTTFPSWTLPEYSSESSFMGAMRRRLLEQRRSGKPSLLDFLLGQDGYWQKGSFTSKSGRQMHGRYALSAPDKQLVQAGHLEARTYVKATGKSREFLMLEDADLNWLSGQTVETQGAYSSKGAVLIDGYPVDIRTARLYESHGLLPAGTVDSAPMIEPPPFF